MRHKESLDYKKLDILRVVFFSVADDHDFHVSDCRDEPLTLLTSSSLRGAPDAAVTSTA